MLKKPVFVNKLCQGFSLTSTVSCKIGATLKAGIRKPESGNQKPESGIRNPESGIENDNRKIHLHLAMSNK